MQAPLFPVYSVPLDHLLDCSVLRVEPTTPLSEVLRQMNQNSEASENAIPRSAVKDCALVLQDHQLIGIFTERDLVRLAATGEPLASKTVAEVMTQPVITLNQADYRNTLEILALFRVHQIRHLPVLNDQQQLLGIITLDSLRDVLQPSHLLRLRSVAEVMTLNVIQASPTTSVIEIARLMTQHQVSCVVICEPGESPSLNHPVGIITERDLVKFQLLNLEIERLQAAEVMSQPLTTLSPNDSLYTAQRVMQARQVRRLVVTGEQRQMQGIITRSSLLRPLDPIELYNVVELLQQQIQQLQTEKLQILQTRNQELEQQISERTAEVKRLAQCDRLLSNILQQIRQSLNLQEILNTTAQAVQELLQTDRVAVYRFNSETEHTQWTGTVVAEAINPSLDSWLNVEISDPCFTPDWLTPYQKGRVRVVEDIYTARMTDCHRERLKSLQIRAKVIIPLVKDQEKLESPNPEAPRPYLWGFLIAMTSDRPRQWAAWEIELLQKLSGQVTLAIQHSELYERTHAELLRTSQAEQQLAKYAQQQAALAQIGAIALTQTDLDLFFDQVVEIITQTLEVQYCDLLELLPNQAAFWMRSGIGWQRNIVKQITFSARPDRSQAGYTLTATEPVIVPDLRLETRFHGSFLLHNHGIASGASVKIGEPDKPFGVLSVYSAEIRLFSEDEINFLAATANALALFVEHKHASSALRTSQQRYATLTEVSPVGIFHTDVQGHCLYVNQRWCEISGLSFAESEGMGWLQAIHPQDRDRILQAWFFSTENNTPFHCEYRFQRPDGFTTWVVGQAAATRSNGQITGFVGTITDISDRKQAEAQIAFQASILDQVRNAAIAVDLTGKIIYWNRYAETLYQWMAAEVWGRNLAEVLIPKESQEKALAIAQDITQKGYWEGEIEVSCKDQTRLPVYIFNTILHDNQGHIIGYVGISIDITERKQTEAALRKASQEFAALVERAPDVIFRIDREMRYLYINPAVETALGYTPTEVIGKKPSELGVDAETLQQWTEILAQIAVTGEDITIEYPFPTRQSPRWFQSRIAPEKAPDGTIQSFLSVAREITAIKRDEERLRQQALSERLLKRTALNIRQSLNLSEILNTTVSEVRQLLQCDRVLVYQFNPEWDGIIVAESVAWGWTVSLGRQLQDTCFRTGGVQRYSENKKTIITNIEEAGLSDCYRALLEQFEVKANLVVPILLREGTGLKGLKPMATPQPLWGLLIAHQCSSPRQWAPEQLDLLDELSVQLAIAIQQSQLYSELQAELAERQRAEMALQQANELLESRVSKRTAQLQHINSQLQVEIGERIKTAAALQQQNLKSRLFAEITLKIRQSLQLEEILQTTVTEVQKILKTDRVLVYHIKPNGTGKVIAESVLPGILELINLEFPEEVFPIEYQNLYLQNTVQAIANIETHYAEVAPCLGDFLQELSVKAKLVVPILQDRQLWGLIIAHQCSAPRHWKDFEVELLQQLADQVGVALSQARLLTAQQQSEAQFRLLAENSTDLIAKHAADGRFLYASPACFAMLGYQPEELIGHSLYQFFHPDYRVKLQEAYQALLKGYEPQTFDYQIRCKNGQYIWFETKARTLCNVDGMVQEIVAVSRDISDRKQAEEQLQRASSQLQAVLDAVPGLVSWVSSDLYYLGVNQQLATAYHQSPESFIGQPVGFERSNPEFAQFIQSFFDSSQSQASQELTVSIKGEVRNYWIVAQKYDSDRAAVSIGLDITERKQTLEELRATTSRLTTLIENLQVGVLFTDEIGRIVLTNQAFCELFEISILPAALIGADFSEFAGDFQHLFVEPQQFVARYQELLTQQKLVTNEELLLADGRTLERDYIPIFVEQVFAGHIWVYRDISQRKQAEEKLRNSLKEKELLLKEIHHRVKNNLLVVSNLLEFQIDYNNNPEFANLLADSQHRIYSMALIHEKLYRSTNLDRINFGEYLESLVENLFESYNISSDRIQLQVDIEPVFLNVETANPCGLIVNELISNALKHAFPDNRKGKLWLGLHRTLENQIILTVQDNGIGIPPELDIHQVNSLGMELVLTLSEQIKAKIQLDRGNGTTFTVNFSERQYRKRW